jgi:uncharacterized membrane protein
VTETPEPGDQLEIRPPADDMPAASMLQEPAAEPVVVDPTTQRVISTVSTYYEEFYSGPLPSAGELAAYNAVVPGLADQITTEWRTETQFRRRLELAGQTAAIRAHRRGQYIGLVIVLFVVGIGAWLTYEGKSTVGVVAMIAPLAGIAGVFVYNHTQGRSRD